MGSNIFEFILEISPTSPCDLLANSLALIKFPSNPDIPIADAPVLFIP